MKPTMNERNEEAAPIMPAVQRMVDEPGVYVVGDTTDPGATIPIVSILGLLHSVVLDQVIDPSRFLPTMTVKGPFRADVESFDLVAHLERQREWSAETFGPGARVHGVIDHIRRELVEVEENPGDLEEWVDVILLALDGAWRAGFSSAEIAAGIEAKQKKNEGRNWPDWRTQDQGRAIEHVRDELPDDYEV